MDVYPAQHVEHRESVVFLGLRDRQWNCFVVGAIIRQEDHQAMKAICVYCGSSDGKGPDYLDKTKELGTALASRGLTLVYGGSKIAFMGQLADAVLAQGGRAVAAPAGP